jgi:hypothetical protein
MPMFLVTCKYSVYVIQTIRTFCGIKLLRFVEISADKRLAPEVNVET